MTSSGAPTAEASVPAALVAAFDNVGITTAGHPAGGDLDGTGDSFDAASLAADALTPGGSLLHDGVRITWPAVGPSQADNVLADGQSIPLQGSGSVLGVVATSTDGPVSGSFVVHYTDGTTATDPATFATWTATTAGAGTDLLASTAAAKGGGATPASLSWAALPIDPTRTVASVTLPTVGSTVGAGVPALHVFDLTVASPGVEAVGAPGALSYYDLARKDCVGTAADTASKAWYTVAGGTLSDVYSPTIDNTDVKTLDPIVTGPGFTASQPRDMTYRVTQLGTTGMACRVVALDRGHHIAVVTDFITDPATDAVVMQDSLVRLPGAPRGLHLYLRFNPLLNGHAGGGTANAGGESATIVSTRRGPVPLSYSTNTLTDATNRTYATPIYAALAANRSFARVETGFVGTASDGLAELDAAGHLTSTAPDASNGNVVQTVELRLAHGTAGTTRPAALGGVGAYAGQASVGGQGLSCRSATVVPAAVSRSGGARTALPSSGIAALGAGGIAASVSAAAGARVTPGAVGSATVALGLAEGEAGALRTAASAATAGFASLFARYQAQWVAYDAGLCGPTAGTRAGAPSTTVTDAYWRSVNVLKASEDKTFIGDTAASLASPWGQAVSAGTPASDGLAPYFGSYREVFPRDAYETFTGFLAAGDLGTARAMVRFFFDRLQLPGGAFPRNGLLNGKAAPDTGGLQLDETADPILAAWQAGLGGDGALWRRHIRPAADFLVSAGPDSGVERWEEQTGYSPSTMADEVAGLVAASAIARLHGDVTRARLYAATADDDLRVLRAATVTTDGPLSSKPYFIRLSKTGDPDTSAGYSVGNGDPVTYDQRTVIDQGFLELSRLGEASLALPANRALWANSLAVAARTIDKATPSGTVVDRYNGDGYGDCVAGRIPGDPCTPSGAPWPPSDNGTGHPWPVLSGENGEYQLLVGHTGAAVSDLTTMLRTSSGVGLVPEQVWDAPNLAASPYGSDPTTASIGFTDGKPDGSAAPLTWAQAQELRLIRDIAAGRLLEQPAVVAARYRTGGPAVARLTVTAPVPVSGGNVPVDLTRPSTTVDAPSTTVSGTAAPGAAIVIDASGTAQGATVPTTIIRTLRVPAGGTWTASVPLQPGVNPIEVAAVSRGGRATSEAVLAVDDLYVPGTVVLQAAAAPGGGNGPGTYAYPTATNSDGTPVFAPGSFRLTGLTVIDSGSTTSFQVGIANMQPTFGSLLGAQLVDLYLHAPTVPAGQQRSTGAGGAWNYSLAGASAWNEAIQVDGFGNDHWVTPTSPTGTVASGTSLGTPQVSVAQLPASGGQTPGLVTMTVPTSTLGTIGSGWTVTLTLAGQDGFGIDDARAFTATPGGYTLGVCSAATAGQSSPPAICSSPPASVPYVMDTIPPSGTAVTSELDPTRGPVVLQGVTVP